MPRATYTRIAICGRGICGHLAAYHAKGKCKWPGCQCKRMLAHLTEREFEALKLFAIGKTAKEVGRAMRIATKTARVHKDHIYAKIGVHGAIELVCSALASGIVKVSDLPPFTVEIGGAGR